MSPSLAIGVLAAAAFVTATISALLGMAGGIALIGVMTAVLPAPIVVPLHGFVQLCSNSTRSLLFARHIYWRIVAVYIGPLVLGTYLATQLWSGEKLVWFRPAIGGFILAFLFWRRSAPKLRNPPIWIYAPLGLATGFIQIFVGATGPFLAPFFLRDDFDKEQVIATKAACQTAGHVLKIPAFFSLGFDYIAHWPLLFAMVTAGFVGTVTGKHLLKRLPPRAFVLIFEGVLATIALYLIVSSLGLGGL